jgi:hypothetical protein
MLVPRDGGQVFVNGSAYGHQGLAPMRRSAFRCRIVDRDRFGEPILGIEPESTPSRVTV